MNRAVAASVYNKILMEELLPAEAGTYSNPAYFFGVEIAQGRGRARYVCNAFSVVEISRFCGVNAMAFFSKECSQLLLFLRTDILALCNVSSVWDKVREEEAFNL